MGETEKELQSNVDGPPPEVETDDARRAYAAPVVTVLDLEAVIKGAAGSIADHLGGMRTR